MSSSSTTSWRAGEPCANIARPREICASSGEYGDGVAALSAIRSQPPHLLFLDIQMDPLNGIELARALDPSQLPSLVFVTAYDSYALEAFEVSAVDYLLKPFDRERFRKTLERGASPAFEIERGRSPVLAGGIAGATGTRRPNRRRRTAALARGVRRSLACARCYAGGNDRGGPQLRAHPRGQGQFPCAQHAATG